MWYSWKLPQKLVNVDLELGLFCHTIISKVKNELSPLKTIISYWAHMSTDPSPWKLNSICRWRPCDMLRALEKAYFVKLCMFLKCEWVLHKFNKKCSHNIMCMFCFVAFLTTKGHVYTCVMDLWSGTANLDNSLYCFSPHFIYIYSAVWPQWLPETLEVNLWIVEQQKVSKNLNLKLTILRI